MEKVVIITRRFAECPNGIGVGDKYTPIPISSNFIDCWAKLFCNNHVLKQHLPKTELRELKKILKENDSILLRNLFLKLQYIDNTKVNYLTHIYKHKTSNIFVYHHWLNDDSQGFNDAKYKMDFLSALRKEVESILKENYDKSFNWIMHDKDIFNFNLSNTLCRNKKVIYKPQELLDMKHNEIMRDYIPKTLQEDNIWCFTHGGEDEYFSKFICENKDWTADSLYKHLYNDIFGCERRIKENGWSNHDILTPNMIRQILGYVDVQENLAGKKISDLLNVIKR